jgi:hypothetical protein
MEHGNEIDKIVETRLYFILKAKSIKSKLRGFSPQAKYTDRATAA